jgi:hypothetical protein
VEVASLEHTLPHAMTAAATQLNQATMKPARVRPLAAERIKQRAKEVEATEIARIESVKGRSIVNFTMRANRNLYQKAERDVFNTRMIVMVRKEFADNHQRAIWGRKS